MRAKAPHPGSHSRAGPKGAGSHSGLGWEEAKSSEWLPASAHPPLQWASWDLQPKGSGERVGVATHIPAPCQLCPVSESPNWLGEVLSQQLADSPRFHTH